MFKWVLLLHALAITQPLACAVILNSAAFGATECVAKDTTIKLFLANLEYRNSFKIFTLARIIGIVHSKRVSLTFSFVFYIVSLVEISKGLCRDIGQNAGIVVEGMHAESPRVELRLLPFNSRGF